VVGRRDDRVPSPQNSLPAGPQYLDHNASAVHATRIRERSIRSFLIESTRRTVESGASVENFFEQGTNDTASVFSRSMAGVADAFFFACVIGNGLHRHAKNIDSIRVFTKSGFLRERAPRSMQKRCARHRRATLVVQSQTDSVLAYTLR